MTKIKIRLFFCTFILAAMLVLETDAMALEGPTEQLKPALDGLIAVLEDDSLRGDDKKAQRRALIMERISDGFDFREMSRRVLGKTWNEISPEEQNRFVAQMTKLLENVYVGKLETYTGQNVEFVAENVKGNRAQVTTLIEDQGAKLPVHYLMRKTGPKWMVYDINIEGVSLIRNYMEQFRSILRTENYDGLIRTIEEKNKSFLKENG